MSIASYITAFLTDPARWTSVPSAATGPRSTGGGYWVAATDSEVAARAVTGLLVGTTCSPLFALTEPPPESV